MSKIAKLFGAKTPKADPAIAAMQAEQAAKAEAQEKTLKNQQDAKVRALRGRNSGFRSLLSGLDTGVLDGADNSGRKQLG
jgi:hypothetical protein